jgi:uncharacterized protein YeeX (DUF496 family)
MKQTKAIQLLSYMDDNNIELKRVEISQFFHTLNKSKATNINGYYGTNIQELIDNNMIRKNKKTNKYKLSGRATRGLRHKNLKPYAKFQNESEHYQFLKKEVSRLRDNYNQRIRNLIDKNAEMKSERDELVSRYSFYWQNTKHDDYNMKVGTLINRLQQLPMNAYIDMALDSEGNNFGDICDFGFENESLFKGELKNGKIVYSLRPRSEELPEDRYK